MMYIFSLNFSAFDPFQDVMSEPIEDFSDIGPSFGWAGGEGDPFLGWYGGRRGEVWLVAYYHDFCGLVGIIMYLI